MGGQTVSEILQDIYRRLMVCYGPQHWWPARETFEVIIGAILTQSAAWINVEKAIDNLRNADKLSPEALRRLPNAELAGLIYPCGYYNVKARKLKAFAQWLGEEYGDDMEKLFAQDIGRLRQHLLGIYGIGEETADSIILYAGNKPVFVIDAYTRRFLGRAGLAHDSKSYSAYQEIFMANLPADTRLFNEYHALLVHLGKEVCRARPLCGRCCLNLQEETGVGPPNGKFPCAVFSQGNK